jgi:malonyl-CoA O-methyltransferase
VSSRLRRGFERAAATYDAHSVLQQEVARRLDEHLQGIVIEPQRIVDLGCGTGHAFEALRRRYPSAALVGVDIAQAMLEKASKRTPWWKRAVGANGAALACADAQRLPLARGSAQMVFSNLMLQWCDAEAVFAEVARVLPAGGLFLFSTFGPDTLKELRGAFAAAGVAERVNTFIDMHDLGDALVHAGFADPVMEMEMITLEYATVEALVLELRNLGSAPRAAGVPRDPLGEQRWATVRQAYEGKRREGALPASYEVVYGHAWKTAPRKLSDGRQVIDFRKRP